MERTPLSRRHNNALTPRRARAELSDKSTKSRTPREVKSSYANKLIKCSSTNTPSHSEAGSQKISVSVRVRPPTPSDNEHNTYCLSKSSKSELLVRSNQGKDTKDNYLAFSYDHVFWFEGDGTFGGRQSDVFRTIAIPLLDSSIEGYNACLFAYGQTGSGKTHSLMDADGNFTDEGMGIIPRFCKELIERRKSYDKFTINVSYYEIYHEKIYDLLSDENTDSRISLKVREHPLTGPYVSGSSSVRVDSFEQVLSLLRHGARRRMTGATLNNERSSRSHTIFDISIQKPTHEQTKVRLVDLAGSERVSQCAVTEERFKEGLSINKSLLILGKVITALAERKKKSYIPYRESLLTWLLRDSLGGNSRTCMLATVSPSPSSVDETLSTLRWAHKARSILCVPTKNEDPHVRLIIELQNEVKRLRALRSDMSNKAPARDSLCELAELQAKLELEKQQKTAEMKLQSELIKLEMNLNEAEKRKCELESQREIILQEASENSIPSYKSDFYDNLKNILDCSMNDSIGEIMREDVASKKKSTCQLKHEYLQKMKDLSECLQSVYEAEVATNARALKSKSALTIMTEIQQRLEKIIGLSQ